MATAVFNDANIDFQLASGSADVTSHSELEGKTYLIEDVNMASASNAVGYRSGAYVLLMVVRNVSAGVIYPKNTCKMKVDGTGYQFIGQVVSNAPTLGDQWFPADEYLPAAGVAINDLFYVVVGGPATVTTDTAGDTTIAIGEHVIPGATTAGRVIGQDTSAVAGTATFAQVNGDGGIAVTAVAGVSTDFVMYVTPKRV